MTHDNALRGPLVTFGAGLLVLAVGSAATAFGAARGIGDLGAQGFVKVRAVGIVDAAQDVDAGSASLASLRADRVEARIAGQPVSDVADGDVAAPVTSAETSSTRAPSAPSAPVRAPRAMGVLPVASAGRGMAAVPVRPAPPSAAASPSAVPPVVRAAPRPAPATTPVAPVASRTQPQAVAPVAAPQPQVVAPVVAPRHSSAVPSPAPAPAVKTAPGRAVPHVEPVRHTPSSAAHGTVQAVSTRPVTATSGAPGAVAKRVGPGHTRPSNQQPQQSGQHPRQGAHGHQH